MNTFKTLTHFGVKPLVAEQIKTEDEMIQFFTHPRSLQSKTALYDQSALYQENTLRWVRTPSVVNRPEFKDIIVPLLTNSEISLNTVSSKRLTFAASLNPNSIENCYKIKKQIVERLNILPQMDRPYSVKQSIFSDTELQNLDQWKKSRDVLAIWEVLDEYTLIEVPELNLDNIYKQMPSFCCDFISEQFGDWITSNIESLKELTELDISSLKIDFLPEQLALLTNLKSLSINDNNLYEVPGWISCLSKLEFLDLTDNIITHLPDQIGDLLQLNHLSLANNQITELPESMINLCELSYLDLSNNGLSEIPFTMEYFHRLKYLLMESNNLSRFPEGLNRLKNIRELYFMKNKIKELPETFESKNKITLINLSHNEISYMPNWLTECSNLCWLNISYNYLQQVPIGLFNMDLQQKDLLPQKQA